MRITLQPSYVLHGRPYRDTSLILEVLTAEHGRVSLLAKGARRSSRGGNKAALLQPFVPLLLSYSGRAELKTLGSTEAAGPALQMRGERIFSGLYLNELLVRLLHRHDAHPELFAAYSRALKSLAGSADMESELRCFEYFLLDELGYGYELATAGDSGLPVEADGWYQYDAQQGLVAVPESGPGAATAYCGQHLLAMSRGEFGGAARLTAKRLLRESLAAQLGGAPLRSRELFRTALASRGVQPPAILASGEGA